MNLNLRPLGPIASGGAVFQVAATDEALWLASPAGLFQFDGAAWQAVMRGIPFWRVNTVLAVGKSIWVAGMPGGMVHSVNGGQAWHRCVADQVEAPIISLTASPNYRRDRVLLAGTDGDGILRSINGGRHWELSNFGLHDFVIFDLVTAPVWDKRKYEYAFAVTDGGIYQSPNGGRAWRSADLGTLAVQPSVIVISPHFETDQTVFAGCEAGELLRSNDAGRSYQLVTDQFEVIAALSFTPAGKLLLGTLEDVHGLESKEFTVPHLISQPLASFPSPVLTLNTLGETFYAGLSDGLYQTSDDGLTWQTVSGLSARRFVWSLTPTSDLWLAGGPEEGIWLSQDEGRSWQAVWSESPVLALTATTNQIWVSSLAGVATSVDAGASWQNILTPELPVTALAVAQETVWAGSQDSQMWYSASTGQWQAVTSPFAGCQMLGLFAKGQVVIAAVWQADSGRVNLWRSEDKGVNWSNWFSQPSPPLLPHIAFMDEAGHEAMIGLGPNLYRSAEASWRRHGLTTTEAPISALLSWENQMLAALTDQLIISDTDDKWTPVESEINGHPIAAIRQVGEKIVVVTSDGQVWLGKFTNFHP